MAEFDLTFDDDFLQNLLQCDFDEICETALKEAAPCVVESIKREVRTAIKHEGDSELAESFKAGKPKKAKNGAWILNVTPKGYSKVKKYRIGNKEERKKRTYPVPNALKAIWKEYGIPGRQEASPFMTRATNNAERKATETIQQVYNRKVGAG